MAIKGGDPILERQNWSTWFFVLSAVMFLCYGAAIYQEFISRRTYIVYQNRFKTFETAKTNREFDAFKTKWAKSEEAAAKKGEDQASLEKKITEAEAKLTGAEYAQLKADRKTQFFQVGYVKSERAKAKSQLDADFYTWKNALHTEGEQAGAAMEKRYHEQEKAVDEWTVKRDAEQKKLDEFDNKLKAYDGAVVDARAALDAHMEPYQKYEEKLAKIDARSPRTIDQIVQPKLGVGGAYTFGTVDRCRSCHVAIDKPGFEQAIFAKLDDKDPSKKYKDVFSTHPDIDPLFTKHPVEQYGCTVCHQGTGAATRIVTPLGGDPDDYAFKEGADQAHGFTAHGGEDFPLYRGDYVQASCQRCHNVQRWLDDAPVYEKGKDIFITKGCPGCHAVKGYEDLARTGPELTHIRGKVTPEWLVQWITNPKAFYPETRMPAFVFNPVSPGQPNPADNIKAAMDPKTFPDHPEMAGIQMETVTKLAAYLWQSSDDDPPMPYGKYPGGGNAAEGKAVVEKVGCIGCHTTGEKGNHRAPPLYKAGAKMASQDWIWNWIHQPRWHAGTTTMPSLRLTDAEAKDVVAYLWDAGKSERKEPDAALRAKLEDASLAKAGNETIAKWGCGGCHLIKGHEKDGRIAPELTLFAEKKTKELAFGDSKVPESWLDWTLGKLTNPRQYVDIRSESRMPWFGFTPDETHALSVYLTGQKNPRVAGDMKKQFIGRAAKIERGRTLVNQYGCVGCHKIEGRGGDILAFNKERALQPPYLSSEGVKIDAEFLRAFLKAPDYMGHPIRQWLKIRMPTFPLTDEERADIISYFRAVDGVDDPYDDTNLAAIGAKDPAKVARGEKFFAGPGNCQACHVYRGARKPSVVADNEAPDLADVWKRYRTEGVKVWLENPQKAMPGVKMPDFFFYDDDNGARVPNGPQSAEDLEAVRSFLFSLTPAPRS